MIGESKVLVMLLLLKYLGLRVFAVYERKIRNLLVALRVFCLLWAPLKIIIDMLL